MSGTVQLWAAVGEEEALEMPWYSTADPTLVPVAWQLSAVSARTPTGSWQAGSWEGTWAATPVEARWVTAVTPLIGPAAALQIVSGRDYRVWIKVRAGSETTILPVGVIRVP